ncbi:hypothetical protein SAMN02745857_03048 [Andreprevotia lacus DSM 23236]|jgi:ribosomal protein S27AE|uniref:C2H2-type domain-containing protein n=1 Tax=Andreprevotia lacus DSM 23236 TaxID=1121001 RepID=A0A1W1XWP8_9NEIS|nr:hypothetical protein [Andreprevotia lacus]SMC27951.1 hypothetical protein SAMN02745857_03048 [Andreprevotia lacus DSM 23236]
MSEPPIDLAAYRKRRARAQRPGLFAWLRRRNAVVERQCVRCGHALAQHASWCQHCGVHYAQAAEDGVETRPAWIFWVAGLVLIALIGGAVLPLFR